MTYFRTSLNFEQNAKVHISGRQKAESNKRPFHSNRSPKKVHKLLLMISIRASICIFLHDNKKLLLIKVVNLSVERLGVEGERRVFGREYCCGGGEWAVRRVGEGMRVCKPKHGEERGEGRLSVEGK